MSPWGRGRRGAWRRASKSGKCRKYEKGERRQTKRDRRGERKGEVHGGEEKQQGKKNLSMSKLILPHWKSVVNNVQIIAYIVFLNFAFQAISRNIRSFGIYSANLGIAFLPKLTSVSL